MKKVLILYASSTGNTEEIASLLEQHLDTKVLDITSKNLEMTEVDVKELKEYDGILFGTYTYDDGDLPFETDVFNDNLQNVDLNGKVIGLFGSGDTAYFQFCEAVDTMKNEFKSKGSIVIDHVVKVDLFPDEKEELDAIKELAFLFQKALSAHAIQSSS